MATVVECGAGRSDRATNPMPCRWYSVIQCPTRQPRNFSGYHSPGCQWVCTVGQAKALRDTRGGYAGHQLSPSLLTGGRTTRREQLGQKSLRVTCRLAPGLTGCNAASDWPRAHWPSSPPIASSRPIAHRPWLGRTDAQPAWVHSLPTHPTGTHPPTAPPTTSSTLFFIFYSSSFSHLPKTHIPK